MTTAEKIEAVLRGSSYSWWLKTALETGLKRDPVDAANDAYFLANILKEHCRAILERGTSS